MRPVSLMVKKNENKYLTLNKISYFDQRRLLLPKPGSRNWTENPWQDAEKAKAGQSFSSHVCVIPLVCWLILCAALLVLLPQMAWLSHCSNLQMQPLSQLRLSPVKQTSVDFLSFLYPSLPWFLSPSLLVVPSKTVIKSYTDGKAGEIDRNRKEREEGAAGTGRVCL